MPARPCKREAGKAFYKVLFIEKVEALWDGEILCGHIEHPHFRQINKNPDWRIVRVNVVDDNAREAAYLGMGRGPLHWGTIFPHILKYYRTNAPTRPPSDEVGKPDRGRDLPQGATRWEKLGAGSRGVLRPGGGLLATVCAVALL